MQRPSSTRLLLLLLGCAVGAANGHADTKRVTPVSPAAPAAPVASRNASRSEFIDDVEIGKDPFFPNSSRRPKVVVKATEPEVFRASVPDWIVLKGISVVRERKLAIINNYTVGEGEKFTLKNNGHALELQCVEIKEKTVIVSANGATKELPLRPGF